MLCSKQFFLNLIFTLSLLFFFATSQAQSIATPYSGTITYPASQPGTVGTRYPIPTNNSRDSTNWGWRCVVTGGSGLTFGGNSPFSKDGCLHTRVLQGGQWVQIDSSLRANNPLQPYHTRAQALRDQLKDALSFGRHIFFQGRTASEESSFLADSVNPGLAAVSTGLSELVSDLQALTALSSYHAGQVAWAATRFTAAAGSIVSFGTTVDSTKLANLRMAQIAIEIAAEALDAEPGARVLSMIAWDSTNQLFVIFGGDHLDYQVNDLWVFDPAIPRWEQRHTGNGPSPRADHFFTPADSGRIRLTGGYGGAVYSYNHVGTDVWYYDVANNSWIKPDNATAYSTDMRTYRTGNLTPEFQMSGAKPAAVSNETLLSGIPSNAWVSMNPPVRGPGHRDWGTLAYDAEHDMIYTYSGGHVAYNGTDVLAYHIATNRYEVPVVPEFPLGRDGANESSAGWTMNKRPWLAGHTWNGMEYHPKIKRMVLISREEGTPDNYIYYYDPMRAEWTREMLTNGMSNSKYSSQACYTSLGMLSWIGTAIWQLNDSTLQWQRLILTGTLPSTSVDNCGLVYDTKRNCIFFFTHGYGKPYDGAVYKLDLSTLVVSKMVPANAAFVAKAAPLREIVYLPKQDLVLFAGTNGTHRKLLVYDPESNLWRSAAIPGESVINSFGVSSGMIYDIKRDLVWYINNYYNNNYVVGDVSVLKIDTNTLVLDTIVADVPTRIAFSAESLVVAPSGSFKFQTSIWCADSAVYTGKTDWSVVGGGTIDSTGLFKSSGEIGVFTIKAAVNGYPDVFKETFVFVFDCAARLKLDENTGNTVEDSTLAANRGTLTGSPTWCTGHTESGLCFTGTNKVVNFKDSRIRFADNFTLSFWAKPTGIRGSGSERYAIAPAQGDKNYGSGHAGSGVSVATNGIAIYEHAANYLPVVLTYDTTLSDWTFVTLVYDKKQPKLYVNGSLVKTGSVSSKIVHPCLTMGGTDSRSYLGSLDEITLFSRVLFDTEILALSKGQFTSNEITKLNVSGKLALSAKPNPFNPSTLLKINYPNNVDQPLLTIINIDGKLIQSWVLNSNTGTQTLEWNGSDLSGQDVASGIYLATLRCGNLQTTKQLMLIR